MSEIAWIIIPTFALFAAGLCGYAWGRKDGFFDGRIYGFREGLRHPSTTKTRKTVEVK